MCQWSAWWIKHPNSPPSGQQQSEETSRPVCGAPRQLQLCVWQGKGRGARWFGLHHACMDLHTSSHRPALKSTLNSKYTGSQVFQKLLFLRGNFWLWNPHSLNLDREELDLTLSIWHPNFGDIFWYIPGIRAILIDTVPRDSICRYTP